jgi:hypothetical protein
MESPSAFPHSSREPGKQKNLVTTSPTLEPGMQISVSRAQQNFTLFPQSPFDIREMIWSEAIEPRTVKITIPKVEQYSNSELEYRSNRSRELYCKPKASPRQAPALLHTSHEARQIGLKPYHFSFSDRLDNKSIYFNFERDTLLFGYAGAFLTFCAMPNPLRLMVDRGSSIIPLASLQYLPSELWRQLRQSPSCISSVV